MERTIRTLAAAALAAAALTLAACGSPSHSGPSASSATAAPAATPSANVQMCHDFTKQVAWLAAHKATVTLVDVATFGGWLQMDAGDSTGKLHTDVAALSAAYQSMLSNPGSADSAGNLVVPIALDCARLGVNVKPGS